VAAFEDTYSALERRIGSLQPLPVETMSRDNLAAALNRIGTEI
jgi:hypothetical protein